MLVALRPGRMRTKSRRRLKAERKPWQNHKAVVQSRQSWDVLWSVRLKHETTKAVRTKAESIACQTKGHDQRSACAEIGRTKLRVTIEKELQQKRTGFWEQVSSWCMRWTATLLCSWPSHQLQHKSPDAVSNEAELGCHSSSGFNVAQRSFLHIQAQDLVRFFLTGVNLQYLLMDWIWEVRKRKE